MVKDGLKVKEKKGKYWVLFFALLTFIISFSSGFKGILFLLITFCLFIFAAFLVKKERGTWSDGRLWLLNFFRSISRYFIILLILSIFTSLIFFMFNLKLDNLDILFKFAPPEAVLFLALLAGPLEELFFRAGVLNFLRKTIFKKLKSKDNISILMSSLLFGLTHFLLNPRIYTFFYIIPTFIIGIILGKIYLKEGLVKVMWLHSVYNMFAIFWGYLLIHGWWFR